MEKENTSSSSDSAQRIATAITTSAISLTLLGCIDPGYVDNSGSTRTGGGYQSPPSNPSAGPTQFTDRQAMDKYFATGYDYVDAKVLANYWGESSPSSAKVRMGRKMLSFGPQEGRAHIGQARTFALRGNWWDWPVNYGDGGYSYEDAELVGSYWGGDVGLGKMKLARNLIQAHDNWNREALAAAR